MNTGPSRRSLILAALLAGAAWSGPARAKTLSFDVALSGAEQVPPLKQVGEGVAHLTYDTATREVAWNITYKGLPGKPTMAHFHHAAAGKNGPVAVWLTKPGQPVPDPIKGQAKLTAAQARQFLAGDWYINLHTTTHPAGDLRGQVMPPKS